MTRMPVRFIMSQHHPRSGDPAVPQIDSYALPQRFGRFLRVTDVTDGLDALGRAELCLMDRSIRPLWMGLRFWGPAVTMRVLPTNRPMPLLTRDQALEQHPMWSKMG